MAARLRVFLTREQDKTLLSLRRADVPQNVRLLLHKWRNLGLESL